MLSRPLRLAGPTFAPPSHPVESRLRRLITQNDKSHAKHSFTTLKVNLDQQLPHHRVTDRDTRRPFHSHVQPEIASLESDYDSLLRPTAPHIHIHELDPFDWRYRSFSRRRYRRNAVSESTIGSKQSTLLPRRQRAVEPDLHPKMESYDLATSYNDHFLPLLEAETEEGASLIENRLQTWPIERLEAEGLCIRSLRAFWQDSTSFGKPVANFSLGVGQLLPLHSFKTGDDVFISRKGPLEQTGNVYRGQVTLVTPTRISVSFEPAEALQGFWRLDLGSSDVAFRRMREAMKSFFFDPQKQLEQELRSHSDIILRGTYLRDSLLPKSAKPMSLIKEATSLDAPMSEAQLKRELPLMGSGDNRTQVFDGVFIKDQRLMSWCKRYSRLDPIEMDGDPDLGDLNITQRRAIALMLAEKVSLVQGPPGTGKTRTLIEAIRLLKAHFEVPQPILVCTYTNVAVDNLVEGLANGASAANGHFSRRSMSLNPLRIGLGWDRQHPLYQHNFLAKVDRHALKPELDKLQDRIDQLQDLIIAAQQALDHVTEELASSPNIDPKKLRSRDKIRADLKEFQTQKSVKQSIYYGLYRRMTLDVCHDADVICTTCITSACFALTILDFPVVFMDEASMSTEPAALIPIMKGSRHLALIGDHKQLPPVIISSKAKRGGLSTSLFERLIEENRTPSMMLDIQYRMHPEISRFPSAEFYDYNLLDGTVDPQGNVAKSLLPPKSKHLAINPDTGRQPSVVFLNHEMPECTRNRSKGNEGEAKLVIGIIEDLLQNNPELIGSNIGIISPYIAQTRIIRDLITSHPEIRQRIISNLGASRARELERIEVKTVDGFEGREKQVIIFSTVRNNEKGEIGFLADRRRLNVGLTRAKRALFLVGSAKTLAAAKRTSDNPEKVSDGVWAKYVHWLEKQDLIVVLRGPALRQSMAFGAEPNSAHQVH